jgi:hypothetical protein
VIEFTFAIGKQQKMDESDENHRRLSPELRKGLATLFLWWYGNHFVIRKVLRDRELGINDRLEDMEAGV